MASRAPSQDSETSDLSDLKANHSHNVWKFKDWEKHIIFLLDKRFLLCKEFFFWVWFCCLGFFSYKSFPPGSMEKNFLLEGFCVSTWVQPVCTNKKESSFAHHCCHIFFVKDSSSFVGEEGLSKTCVGRGSFISIEKHARYIFILWCYYYTRTAVWMHSLICTSAAIYSIF